MLTATATPQRAVLGKEDAREKEGGWPLPQQLECGACPPAASLLSQMRAGMSSAGARAEPTPGELTTARALAGCRHHAA